MINVGIETDWNPFIGVPFQEDGSSFEGWNCWTLVCCAYERFLSLQLPRYEKHFESISNYPVLAQAFKEEGVRAPWHVAPIISLRKFDIIQIRMRNLPLHVGLVIDPQQDLFIHVEEGKETCIENYSRINWKKRIMNAYRHQELR